MKNNSESGIVLVVVIFLMVFITMLGFLIMSRTDTEIKNTGLFKKKLSSRYIAEGGMNLICQALADTTRIAILYELAEGRKNVTQLVEALGSPQATVSRHLKVLRERGMVNSERDGVNVYYSLADQRVIEALNLLRGVMADILGQRSRLAEALRA